MGIFKDLVTSQLIDVIEWTDDSQNTMVYKYDMNGKEIMMGAQLTVRESQAAIFVNEGKLADVFQPGRYEGRVIPPRFAQVAEKIRMLNVQLPFVDLVAAQEIGVALECFQRGHPAPGAV